MTVADAVRVNEFLIPSQMDGEDPFQPAFTAAIQISSPVRMDQLAAEVADLTDLTEVALMSDGDPAQASAEVPVYLWTEAGIPADSLEDAAQAHQPDPDWLSGSAESAPQLEAIREKARQRQMLTSDEMQAAVWHLLGAEDEQVG